MLNKLKSTYVDGAKSVTGYKNTAGNRKKRLK